MLGQPPSAKPTFVLPALLDPFQIYSRPPMAGAYLGSAAGDAIPGPVKARLLGGAVGGSPRCRGDLGPHAIPAWLPETSRRSEASGVPGR
jgi:hypothetical protein